MMIQETDTTTRSAASAIDTGYPMQQLVRPQGFYPEPANPIPCQIQQKDFPIKPLVSGKQDQKDQKNQIPQGFIEKRGMYLDIRDTIYFHHVLQQAVRHI